MGSFGINFLKTMLFLNLHYKRETFMHYNPNDPQLKSWVPVAPSSDFSIQNLPFGIFAYPGKGPRVGVAIGDFVLDLAYLQVNGLFDGFSLPNGIFLQPYLNAFIALGKPVTNQVRMYVSQLLNVENQTLQQRTDKEDFLVPQSEIEMKLPVYIRDYTDFYSSEQHAFNVGSMFRDPDNALLPNWKHIPVGYHGRASSIIPSEVPIHRPNGQTKADDSENPSFGPTKLLDFELEMAFIVSKETQIGETVSTKQAEDFIFGFVLFNDWSARDVQKWEYVPLGPFLAKNFASSVSPWVVTLEALAPFRVAGKIQDPKVLPYLQFEGEKNFDINLQVAIQPENSSEKIVSNSNFKHMYWNVNQQLAHHTVNGCNLGVGDLLASGTISGPTPESYGSMLELTWRGTRPIKMSDNTERKFIHDGDTVIMRGHAQKNNIRVGFGEVRTKVLPAKQTKW